ncbi:hypothetical protein Y848_08800 [Clostridium botulinum C/D str. Sp77]|nr:hypothetical protein Z953_04900 [Clostridium botulinum D str. 16868]KEI05379.1 hypothetical protein Y848_08800 [Clostridium botulinum C/D str. Sp77]
MKSTKKLVNVSIVLILVIVSAVISYIHFTVQKFNDRIFPGIVVEDVNLSGNTKDDAVKILTQKYSNAMLNKKINIKVKDRNYFINYSELNAKYNIKDTVDHAMSYGKDLNMFSKYKIIKGEKIQKYDLELSYNVKPIEKMINKIAKEVNVKPVDARLNFNGGSFAITPDKKGLEVEKDKLKKEILANLNDKKQDVVVIEAPVKVTASKVTGEVLKSVNAVLGSYSTSYATSAEPRANNVAVATRSINGKVVMPGETFSFNEIVGERTKERGYQEAGVIVNQKLESGLGGGVCQVSSTLYNALLKSNIKMTERVHHTFPSTYVPIGLDATVDWGNIDLKFKNTFKFPIYIEGYTAGREVGFNIYSNSELAKTKCQLTSEVYNKVEPKTQYINDPNLPAGATEVVKSAHTGYRVRVYKSIYTNGKFVSKELVSTDYYVPVNGVIKRGTR